MSTRTNTALFDLIKAMTKSEKRYFKVLSSRHTINGENNYVRLFDFIEAMEEYDESAIKVHFKGETLLNRFSITKKRLYDHILNALDAFHAGKSVEAQLQKMLNSADILYDKSLYAQCGKLLNSAEKLAAKNELFEFLLQIQRQKRRLIETEGYIHVSSKELDGIEKVTHASADQIVLIQRLWQIKSELFRQLNAKGMARSEREVEHYKTLCGNELDKFEIDKLKTEGKYLYNHIQSAYAFACGNLCDSLDHLKANLEHLQASKTQLLIEPNKHFSVLTNAIYIADKIGDHNLAFRLLGELKSFANDIEPSEDLRIKLFSSISSIDLSLDLRMGDFCSAKNKVERIAKELIDFEPKMSSVRRAFLEFKIAVVYIGNNEFNESLKWINRILNDNSLDKTEDIIGFTQLLDLLVHIELDHNKLLPYTLKSAQRYFKTRDRLYNFERVFLKFVSKMIKCEDHFEMQEKWEELCNELSSLTNEDHFESIALDYFDFHSWAESKLKQKSFDLVVREKYNRAMKNAS